MKMELRHALRLWKMEQVPLLEVFTAWLTKKDIQVPPEGERWNEHLWDIDLTEEGVRNPKYYGLTCWRIELWRK